MEQQSKFKADTQPHPVPPQQLIQMMDSGMVPVNERFRQSGVSYSYPAAAKTTGIGASAPAWATYASFQGEGRKLGGGNDGADSTIFAIGSNDGMQDAINDSLPTLAVEREKRKKANSAAHQLVVVVLLLLWGRGVAMMTKTPANSNQKSPVVH